MVAMLTLAVLSPMGDPIRLPFDSHTPIAYSVTPAAQDLTPTMTSVQITHIAAEGVVHLKYIGTPAGQP